MSAQILIERLDGVRTTGRGTWLAKCPAHDDRTPSLSIRELDDGRTLVHCFSGCDVASVVNAIGLELDALFPPRAVTLQGLPGERRPFPAADVLRAISHEALVVAIVAARIASGETLTGAECARCAQAAGRIRAGVDVALPERDRRREFAEAAAIAEHDLAEFA
ncbi:MAG: DNA primase [Casimicrobiaceae bacterium]